MRESALKLASGRRILCSTRELTLCQQHAGPYAQPSELHPQPIHWPDGFICLFQVKRGVWLGHDVAVNLLANPAYREDFLHGLHMLRQLRSKVNVTQIVGFCEQNNIFVTELHPLGSADHLEAIFLKEYFRILDTLSVRFALCEQYVNILRSLHDNPDGARVMCDSNDVKKTLSQFLLRDDVTLILNDVDALPLVDKTHGKLIKCGHHELFGTFVAPEQLWPHEDRDFNDTEMLGYDEKVDIWKIPDVCDAFLGHVEGSARLRLQLLPVHLKCKSVDPTHRPSARDVQEVYERVREKLNLLLS